MTAIFKPLVDFFHLAAFEVGYWITYLAGYLISFAVSLIQLMIELGANVAANPVVQEGFKISLNVANLGFVLAIIILAFATMFRWERYQMKVVLKNLVFAAILINFSFGIAGVFIDFTNVLGNFFISASTPDNGKTFADNLANAFNIQKMMSIVPKPGTEEGSGFLKFGADFLKPFALLASVTIFNIVLVITFFAIALMLLARYIWLIFLLIIMPIAWMFSVFPELSGHWKSWWSNFLKWNFFFPAVSFFVYLSILTAERMGALVENGRTGKAAPIINGTANALGLTSPDVMVFVQILIQAALAFGGLYAANKIGITGANTAMGFARTASNWMIGKTGRAALLPVRAGLGAGKAVGAPLAAAALRSRFFKGMAGATAKVPGLKGVAAGMYNLAEIPKEAVADQQNDIAKAYKSDEALLVASKAFTPNPARRAAFAQEIVKRNLVDKADPAFLKNNLELAEKLGVKNAVTNAVSNAPYLAPQLMSIPKLKELAKDENIDDKNFDEKAMAFAMSKFRPSKTEELPPQAIEKLARFFANGHQERLAKEGTLPQLISFMIAARSLQTTNPGHPTVRFVMNNPAMQRVVTAPEYAKEYESLKRLPKQPTTPQQPETKIETAETKRKEGPNVGI
ncbi:MAG: hypothetical protein AAB646_00685 [Patescibacteria group bacterium]